MEDRPTARVIQSVRTSPFAKILMMGFLVLILQIPSSMIRGVIDERQATRREAVNDVTSKWGRGQIVMGPSITVPYIKRWEERTSEGKVKTHSAIRYATFLPEDLHSSAKIDSEVRYRGIFKVPVYRMTMSLTGHFTKPDLSQWQVSADDILWDRAYLAIGISDVRAINNQAVLDWNDEKVEFLPGTGEASPKNHGIHADLKSRLTQQNIKFAVSLDLNGSEKVLLAPFGKETRAEISSNWADPSFQGAWLPSHRTVTPEGFTATWTIPFLGRNYPQRWSSEENIENSIPASLFGVSLISPVDHYRMAERSVKYVTLFLVLTFATLWLFEVVVGMRIHSIQYLLMGAGMCLFYLLELALAEHIGFNVAYAIATLAIVVLVASYCMVVLKSPSRAMIVGGVVTVLYGYLYVLLRDQDYALLVGAVGLFVVLAIIMFMTRKVDWYAPRNGAATQ